MTVVGGRVARPIGLDSFADLTDAPLVGVARDGLTFDGELTAEQVDAIRWRMASRDADDEQARSDLRDLCASLDTENDQTAAAVCAVINYLLNP